MAECVLSMSWLNPNYGKMMHNAGHNIAIVLNGGWAGWEGL